MYTCFPAFEETALLFLVPKKYTITIMAFHYKTDVGFYY